MAKYNQLIASKSILILIIFLFSGTLLAQELKTNPYQELQFWQRVQFGGGLALGFGTGYTEINVSPSAIYNINPVVAVGTSLQFGYVSSKNFYSSTIYGGSLIGLVNPIPQIQLSVELEEININTDYKNNSVYDSENFWNTSLYLGAGYRTGNITIGARYNVLFNENRNYYSNAFMPFVRVYF